MNKIYAALTATLTALTLTLALAADAPAQTTAKDSLTTDNPSAASKPAPTATPAPAPAKAPKQLKLGKVNVSGSLRLRAESYGWFETPGFDDSYTFGAAQLRVILSQQRERLDWLVEDAFAQVQLKPHARISLRADVHALRLSSRNDLWYSGGGAFQETSFGYQGRTGAGRRGLGTLFDLSADVTLTPNTTLTLYGAGVRGGGVESAVYPAGGADPTARLLYAELTRRF